MDDLGLLKSLVRIKGKVDYQKYFHVLKGLSERLGLGVRPKSIEEDRVLLEWVRRKYKVGGRRRLEYLGVLKRVMSKKDVKEMKESMGEIR